MCGITLLEVTQVACRASEKGKPQETEGRKAIGTKFHSEEQVCQAAEANTLRHILLTLDGPQVKGWQCVGCDSLALCVFGVVQNAESV